MLRRAALPLLRPRPIRPLIPVREALSQTQLRWNSRGGPRDSPYRIPGSDKDSPSTQRREPIRKVPAPQPNPASKTARKSERSPQSTPFGVDPTRDLDDVSESVSQASERAIGEEKERRQQLEDDAVQSNLDDQAAKPRSQSESGEADPSSQQPLPDLTKGIPSTLDAELTEARAKQTSQPHPSSLNITEDPSGELPSGARGRDGGDIPRTEYISSSDRKRNAVFRYMYTILGLGSVAFSIYLGRNWENEEEEKAHADAPSGWGFKLFYNRVAARLGSTMSYYRDPVTTKLLPDEDPDPNLRYPFTLVISLEDMLIHSEWTREKGWRIAKRPGVDYFLRYLGSYYEIVLFTSQPMAMTEQVLRKLDPYSTIRWPLFREATVYKDGGYVKVSLDDHGEGHKAD